MLLGGGVERRDLVFEDRVGEVEVDGALPVVAPAGGAATVGNDHREALVGEPLRGGVAVAGAAPPAARAGPP